MTHEELMREALSEARKAFDESEIPVGAVMARGGEIIARAHNLREQTGDPTAHAEVLAIREAARAMGGRRLSDCTLYVTLEPCPMCAGAMVMACLDKCYFGARDERQGCCESVYALPMDPAFSAGCWKQKLPNCSNAFLRKEERGVQHCAAEY